MNLIKISSPVLHINLFFGILGSILFITGDVLSADKKEKKPAVFPYKNSPAVTSKIKALGDNSSLWLGTPAVTGLPDGWKKSDRLKTGPFTRGYCMKMPYAPDRKTAFYCGQDHNLPHFNDVWEYHLGSNTWHCLTPPDGGDTGVYWRKLWVKAYGRNGKGMEKNEDKRRQIKDKIKAYMIKTIMFKNGYMQTAKNGGPVFAWHTWDGLTYDPISGKMLWAVLDDDSYS